MAMIDWEDRTPPCRARMLAHLRHRRLPQTSVWTAVLVSACTVAHLTGMFWSLLQ